MKRYSVRCENHKRRGLVLLVVTITVVMLTMAAWSYSSRMLTELESTAMGGRGIAARMAAESGIEFAATRIMERDTEDDVNVHHDPDSFHARLVRDSTSPRGRLRFSVIVPDEAEIESGGTRFGLATENSKFNVNRLIDLDALDTEHPGLAYDAISVIPGMTEDIVNAILDALDTDDVPRQGGAELSDYESVGIYDAIPNGPFDSIDQLLLVTGVTPELFYGEDANRNGLLDPHENDGDRLPPTDNADGILDLGWRDYLTASSRERNTSANGEKKINLNQGQMTELYDAIEETLGEDAANFIVGYRLSGTEYATKAFEQSGSSVTGNITRNGIDLTIIPSWQFTSIYELVGGTTNDVKMVSGTSQTFESPWREDVNTLQHTLPELEQILTTTDQGWIEGRININQARNEVLQAIPFIPAGVPDSIIAGRPAVRVQGSSGNMNNQRSAAWLVIDRIADMETLRKIGPWITTGGDVFSLQSLGHYDQGGPAVRLEAMIDATEYPPRITFMRDLTHLPHGYLSRLGAPDSD
ncbi:MAG: general secretion pathway protein GspK [Fuerstiella sp.]|nr:general secretion pathway protein GspK [Fuerstiella sp.]